jgi:hypothetical protein
VCRIPDLVSYSHFFFDENSVDEIAEGKEPTLYTGQSGEVLTIAPFGIAILGRS